MNERIRELALQAEQYAHELIDPNLNWNEQPRYFTEKFAELIVRECASKVTRNEALNIFEHFGVEDIEQ